MNPYRSFTSLSCVLLALAALAGSAAAAPAVFSRAAVSASRLPAALAARPDARAALLEVSAEGVEAFRAQGGGALVLPSADGELTLDLEPYEIFGPEGVTVTDASGTRPSGIRASVYRGAVAGEPGSWAVVTLSDAGASAVIERSGGRLLLGPAERTPRPGSPVLHVLTDEQALPADAHANWTCGADEASPVLAPNGLPKRPAQPYSAQVLTQRLDFDVAVDCDYEIYHLKFGNNLGTATNYMLTVLGTVSLIYERDVNVRLNFPYVNLWTDVADPYTAGNTSAELTEFQNWWLNNRGSVQRSTAHLVSGRSLGGGIAFLNGLCGTTAFGVSAIDAVYSYPTFTTTWDVEVIAHELGHNFGSPHTHSCYWQQNFFVPAGALLDTCYATEGSCNNATRRLPADKGTIMSYCHLLAGVANGIRLDFHPACKTVIRNGAESAICRSSPFPQPPHTLVFTPTSSGGVVSWTPGTSFGVVRWDVRRSAFPLDPGATLRGSSTTASFADTGLGTFYYRVRAVRTADSSEWSGEVRGTLCALGTPASYAAAGTPMNGVRGDFDENGIEDVAVANLGGGGVSVLLGQGTAGVGDGTFAAAAGYTTGASPIALAKGDFNGDGILDLVTSNNGAATLTVLTGEGTGGVGTGTFTAGDPVAVSGEPWGLATADFDEDGIGDLVVALGSGGLGVLRGQGAAGVGDGTFAAPVTFATSTTYAVTIDDFNDDGIWDLAVATVNGARVLLGNGTGGKGDGTFGAFVTYPCQSQPVGITRGDWNTDGITDLAVSNASSASMSLLLGQGTGGVGDGTFAAAVNVPAGASPYSVSVADWTGDGIADLMVANSTSVRTVSVLVGNATAGVANGTFSGAQPFASSIQPRGIVIGDYNEDGAPDVVATSNVAPTVARLFGSCGPAVSSALTLDAPNGGEIWIGGEEQTISWTKGGGVIAVDVQVSRDGGANWRTIAEAQHGSSFTWTVTEPYSTDARVRVVDSNFPNRNDASDAALTLSPTLGVDAPGRGRTFALAGAWPNPARRSLAVSFALPDGSPAALELLDLAGRRVAFREVGSLGAGSHRVALVEGVRLRPGLYLVRLSRGGASHSLKVAFVQ